MQGPVVQNYKIYIILNSVIKLKDYVISFSYSIQNYVSDYLLRLFHSKLR
jgi:hypothetical protein